MRLNSTGIAIFVKTPELSPLKTRLAAGIGDVQAHEFYELSVRAVEETVRSAVEAPPHPDPPPRGGRGKIEAYWAVGEEDGVDHPLWSGFPSLWTGEGDLGVRQSHVYDALFAKHEKVILIGADAPQISGAYLSDAIAALDEHDFVIGPARDGGYVLFGGRVRVARDVWEGVPWSSVETRTVFEKELPSNAFHLPTLTDVDVRDDLQAACSEMPENMSEAQRALCDWVEANH